MNNSFVKKNAATFACQQNNHHTNSILMLFKTIMVFHLFKCDIKYSKKGTQENA